MTVPIEPYLSLQRLEGILGRLDFLSSVECVHVIHGIHSIYIHLIHSIHFVHIELILTMNIVKHGLGIVVVDRLLLSHSIHVLLVEVELLS